MSRRGAVRELVKVVEVKSKVKWISLRQMLSLTECDARALKGNLL